MKIRVLDQELATALKNVVGPGGNDARTGLIFQARTGLSEWADAEDELAEAFELTRETASADAPVVYLVQSSAIVGRAGALDSAVATGLLGGARALAFERRKTQCYSTVVAMGENVAPTTVADTINLLVATRGANGQVFALGVEHLGAALP